MNFIQFYSITHYLIFTFLIIQCKPESICNVKDCVGIASSSPIFNFCNGPGHHINKSCCFDKDSETLIGVDLKGCSISDTSNYLPDLTTVEYMSLIDSKINCSVYNFKGMVKLTHLWISDKCQTCPGGDESWSQTTNKSCTNQTDSCLIHNFTCPDNSHCTDNGPGLFHCICTDPFYGYKCMQKGQFPITMYAISLSISTLLLSGILWFLTLRKTRYVITNN